MVPYKEIIGKILKSLCMYRHGFGDKYHLLYAANLYAEFICHKSLNYSEDHGVPIIIVAMIGMLFVQPVVGFLSDRFGRKPSLMIGSLGLLVSLTGSLDYKWRNRKRSS